MTTRSYNQPGERQGVSPPRTRASRLSVASIFATLIGLTTSSSCAFSQSVEGFAEPVQTVDVASPESGTVQEVLVRQGQKVRKGDVLVQMDPDALLPALELAKAKAEARAKMEAAKIELQVK